MSFPSFALICLVETQLTLFERFDHAIWCYMADHPFQWLPMIVNRLSKAVLITLVINVHKCSD